jgi:riboflavin biosynthesis pyrimidine reductase
MSDIANIYQDLNLTPTPKDRPYVVINMVTTIDGKTVSGQRGDDVKDLGSDNDHTLMRRIQDQVDAVVIGAGTFRASDKTWDPKTKFRVVVSNTGGFDYGVPYFQGKGRAFVACSQASNVLTAQGVERLEAGKEKVDPATLLKKLREMGSERLLCFGGSELNAQFLASDLVDELFLTISPKVKLGRDLPTYAGGEPLPRDHMLLFDIKESHTIGNEVFLRYRRSR